MKYNCNDIKEFIKKLPQEEIKALKFQSELLHKAIVLRSLQQFALFKFFLKTSDEKFEHYYNQIKAATLIGFQFHNGELDSSDFYEVQMSNPSITVLVSYEKAHQPIKEFHAFVEEHLIGLINND